MRFFFDTDIFNDSFANLNPFRIHFSSLVLRICEKLFLKIQPLSFRPFLLFEG